MFSFLTFMGYLKLEIMYIYYILIYDITFRISDFINRLTLDNVEIFHTSFSTFVTKSSQSYRDGKSGLPWILGKTQN